MSIRTCPTCGTDVDVSNGLFGCPVCGASLAAAARGRDEVPTSILQFFDDQLPDDGEPEGVPSRPEPGPGDAARARPSTVRSGGAVGSGVGDAAGPAGPVRRPDDTRELPRVSADPSAGPGVAAHGRTDARPAASADGRMLFDDLAGPGASGASASGPGSRAGGADAVDDGSRRRPARAARRLPGGLLLVAAFALGGLAVFAAFALRGGSSPAASPVAPAPSRPSTPTTSSSAVVPAPSGTADAP
ncbi:MAG TPA: hypothetical protein VFS29_00570, partial [Motilibacteraceae bacterium]|nr:hypothetical protein [Motilibacteraceae bacterium]